MGVLHLTTGSGKTILSAEIIRRMKIKTLFITPRIELNRQTVRTFNRTLGIECREISEGKFEDGDVCVATFQTIMALLKRDKKTMVKFLESIGLLIVDEAHISASKSFMIIGSYLKNTVKRIGLTGTLNQRADGNDMKVEALLGKEIYKFKQEALNSGFLANANIVFYKIDNEDSDCYEYQEEYQEFNVENELRNNKIKDLANKVHKDKSILILTNRIEHSNKLGELIGCPVITGGTNSKERKEIFEKFTKGDIRVMVGSLQIFQLGIDIPELDVIINCSGLSAPISCIQTLGRVLRKGGAKSTGYYIDFIDENTKYLKGASWKRFSTLKKEGHKPRIAE